MQTDAAANTTGTVFDLDGDGVAEVIFNDACYLQLYDGRTGAKRLSLPSSDGGFWHYPVVADVHGDAHAEIVVAANEHSVLSGGPTACAPDSGTGATFDRVRVGVRVFRDPEDRWMPARPIWNQHAYSVTNVLADGSIPVVPERNWELPELNDYRRNSGEAVINGSRGIDLSVRGDEATSACPEHITLRAIVANRGTIEAPRRVSVGFYIDRPREDGGLLACTATVDEALAPGESRPVSCDWLEPGPLQHEIRVHVDDGLSVAECDEENNDAWIPAVRCPGID